MSQRTDADTNSSVGDNVLERVREAEAATRSNSGKAGRTHTALWERGGLGTFGEHVHGVVQGSALGRWTRNKMGALTRAGIAATIALSMSVSHQAQAEVTPVDEVFKVNDEATSDSGSVYSPVVAGDADGNFVVVWEDGPAAGVLAQYYDSDGTPVGSNFEVYSGSVSYLDAAMNDDGNFVVTWSQSGSPYLYYTAFDAGATSGTYGSFYASSFGSTIDPAVAIDADGDFVIAWEYDDGTHDHIYYWHSAESSAEIVDTNNPNSFSDADVAMDDSGNFVIAFERTEEAYASTYSVAKDTSGVVISESSKVMTGTNVNGADPVVAFDSNGDFVMVWEANNDIRARRFGFDGSPAGDEIDVPDDASTYLYQIDVSTDDVGGFVVVWDEYGTDGNIYVYAQRYDADDNADGDVQTVSPGDHTYTATAGGSDTGYYASSYPTVAADADGDFAVAWVMDDGHTSAVEPSSPYDTLGGDVFARVYTVSQPDMAITSDALEYTEGDGAVIIDSTVLVTDTFDILNATVAITEGYQMDEDMLSFTDTTNITSTWDAMNGTLILSGTDTAANYQAAFQSVAYENTSDDPSDVTRTVLFSYTNEFDQYTSATRDINVTPVNDAPELVLDEDTLAYTEGDGPVPIDSTTAITDVDNTELVSASVMLDNFMADEDVLDFTAAQTVTDQFDLDTTTPGMLVFTPADGETPGVADFEMALQGVTYENTSESPDTTTRTAEFLVSDGTDIVTDTRDISVAAVNDAPVVSTSEMCHAPYTNKYQPIFVDKGVSVSDIDNSSMPTATVHLEGDFTAGVDMLSFTDTPTITGSFDATTGILTLSGDDSPAAYQAALQTVMFKHADSTAGTYNLTVRYVVSDGEDSNSDTCGFSVTVPATTTTTINREGGTAPSNGGSINATFGEGDTDDGTGVSITERYDDPQNLPEGTGVINHFDVSGRDSDSNELDEFDGDYDLTVTYTDEDLEAAGITDESSLVLAYWDETLNQWVQVPTTIDPDTNTATGQTNVTGEFVLISVDQLLTAPTNLTATGTLSSTGTSVQALSASVDLAWEYDGTASVQVESSTGSGWSVEGTTDGGATSYTDTSVLVGQPTSYRVRSVDDSGMMISEPSNVDTTAVGSAIYLPMVIR